MSVWLTGFIESTPAAIMKATTQVVHTNSMEHEHRLTEILANAITHGIGLILTIIGAIYLIYITASGSRLRLISCAVYAATLVLVYFVSTLYHSLVRTPARQVFQILDHSAIYLLIAGTYTPFSLLCFKGWLAWAMIIAIWSCAIAGLIYKGIAGYRHPRVSLAIYLLMGWIGVLAIVPMIHAISLAGVLWILAGGVFYTLGVYFYNRDNRSYYHALWHIFVLLGSLTHYLAVLFYAVPHHA
jgi:hemolysin III